MMRGRSTANMNASSREEIRARRHRDFKRTGLDLILACQVKSIIIPLLADHILREAHHFLTVLTER